MKNNKRVKLTSYQVGVIQTWIAELHAAGFDREDAIAQAQCQLPDECAEAVRKVFDERWPAK